MSLIVCLSKCVYQQDGYCSLERAGSMGLPSRRDPCVNYVPSSQDGGQRLADIVDTDEL